jgi:tetratricopeptide (TPR) repeat protein
VLEEKYDDAVKTYEDFISKRAENPYVPRAHLALANLWKQRADKLGSYLSMGEADKGKWQGWIDSAIKNAEQGIEKFPESNVVAQLLNVLLEIDTKRMQSGLKKADEVKAYFTGLANKFEGKTTKPKILFAFANFLADSDKTKKGDWFEIMDDAFKEDLVFSPGDLDRYGNALVDRKKLDKAKAVFDKLAKDYPLGPNQDPSKVTRTIGDAQAVSMAGRARILQTEGKAAEGQKILEELKTLYPWSAKVAEADFGIAAGLFEQKKYEEAVEILTKVSKNNAAPVKLRAQSMMLTAKALEAQQIYDDAINNYIKIASFFEAERDLAAEGLWRGAQLLEGQASGKIAMPKPKPKATPKAEAAKKGDKSEPAAKPKAGDKATPSPGSKPTPKASAPKSA